MYDFHGRYLASTFLDAESIGALDAESIADLFTLYKAHAVLPLSLFETDESGRFRPRVGFYSPSKGFQIGFTSTRFNVELKPETPYAQLKLGSPLGELSEFSEGASQLLTDALDFFERKCHRLALVQEGYFPNLSQGQMSEIAQKLLNRPGIPEGEPFEWNWRTATKVERTFCGRNEITNTIITVRRLRLLLEEKEKTRIRLDIDINTDSKDVRARFGKDEITAFFDEAPRWHEAIVAEIGSFLGMET